MAEWSIAHAWKACVVKSNREFESLSLRHSSECFFLQKFQTVLLFLRAIVVSNRARIAYRFPEFFSSHIFFSVRIASKIERTERERKASKSERVLMVCN